VEFEGELPELYQTNLWLRTASRVLVRLGEFSAALFPELRRKAHNLPWERFLVPGEAVDIRVTSHASKLYMKRAVAEHVQSAIADRMGAPSSSLPMDKGGQGVVVRFDHDLCTISVDSSGELLHRRGYRQATAKAPLRETLAAGMILASGWDAKFPLIDPFCGSGTIPIEAALLGLRIPPGAGRRFRFEAWPGFDRPRWQSILRAAESNRASSLPPIQGSDRDAGAVQISIANAERAGVVECVGFSQRAVSAIAPPQGPGWVVTNPPYGVRVSEGKDLRNLYAQFGHTLRRACPGWQVAMLGTDDRLFGQTGVVWRQAIALVNGGLRVKLALGEVKA
jgi:putative N6-adenine-specific DNA methylase